MRANSNTNRKKLLAVLDESMKSIFGRDTTEAVYYYLEKRYLLKPEDILERSEAFMEAIKGMFGEIGASVIESLLVRDLCTKFGVERREGRELEKLADCLDELMPVNESQNDCRDSHSEKVC